MLDQGLVRSGFDAEILLGERQFSYLLLALVDAGLVPTQLQVGPALLGLLGPEQIDRTYPPNPDAPFGGVSDTRHPFEVEILFGHPSGADLRLHPVLSLDGLGVEADMFVALALTTQPDELSMLASALLHVEVRDIDSPILPFVESQFGVDKATILAEVKARVDRDIDLGGFGDFKRLQSLAVRKLEATDDHPRAYGIYVNLRLQQGPEPMSLKRARQRRRGGELPARRLRLGHGLAQGLFGDMATDAFERLAEIDAEGHVTTLHKSIHNPKSEVIGKIKGVSVGPGFGPQGQPQNTLRIDVHVECEIDNFFDPDGHS
jgi:hypothetical protein